MDEEKRRKAFEFLNNMYEKYGGRPPEIADVIIIDMSRSSC